jgi:hypothetical protein
MSLDDGHAAGYQLALSGQGRMSDVDDIIDRQASPADAARIAPVIASDFRLTYFGSAAFAVRLLRLDQKLIDGIPMNPRRMSKILNTKPELLQEFCGHLAKSDDETVVLIADGRAVEIPVF